MWLLYIGIGLVLGAAAMWILLTFFYTKGQIQITREEAQKLIEQVNKELDIATGTVREQLLILKAKLLELLQKL